MNEYNLKPGDKVRVVDLQDYLFDNRYPRFQVGDELEVKRIQNDKFESTNGQYLYYDRVVPVSSVSPEPVIQLWPL